MRAFLYISSVINENRWLDITQPFWSEIRRSYIVSRSRDKSRELMRGEFPERLLYDILWWSVYDVCDLLTKRINQLQGRANGTRLKTELCFSSTTGTLMVWRHGLGLPSESENYVVKGIPNVARSTYLWQTELMLRTLVYHIQLVTSSCLPDRYLTYG